MGRIRRTRAIALFTTLGVLAVAACTTGGGDTATVEDSDAGADATDGSSSADGATGTDASGGSDATADPDGGDPDGGGDPDAGADPDGGADPDAGDPDAGACATGLVRCSADPGAACVDLATDSANCGTCGTDCLGSTCSKGLCAPEKASPTHGCVWGLAVASGTIAWTENLAGGCSGAILTCPTTGCATIPPGIAAPSNLPMGIAIPPGAASLFFADNQYPGPLRKMDLDGKNLVEFTNGVTGNGAGVVANATHVFWGNSAGVYRSSVGAADSKLVLTGDMSGAVANAPSSIALDASSFYAAPGGYTVRSCPLAGDCHLTGSTVIATEPNVANSGVGGIASDGAHVFYTGGNHYTNSSGTPTERLVRCPVAGCPDAEPIVLWQAPVATNFGQSTHFGVAVDAKNVYWGTIEGTVWFAPKDCTAPCTATALATGAQPFGMTIDGPFLYWADNRGIYRVVRP